MEFLYQQEYHKLLDFIAFRDASLVRKACNGLGTDDDLLISILCQRTKSQIQNISNYSDKLYSNTLKEIINNECSGNYKKFLLFLCETRGEYLYGQLKDAMGGLGCDKSLVNELLCLSTRQEVEDLKNIYEKIHDKPLSDKLRSELSGEHEALIMFLLLRGRGDNPPNLELADDQAERLHRAIDEGSGMLGGLDDSAQRTVREIFLFLFIFL